MHKDYIIPSHNVCVRNVYMQQFIHVMLQNHNFRNDFGPTRVTWLLL